ncbi:hypothetical protein Tco_0859971, partial [Tanacetum coccineum]
VSKTNESEGLSKPVTPQNLPQTATQAVRNTNVIKPGMYRIASSTTQTRAPQLTQTSRNTNPRVSTSTGVAHRTNVSRPQPRSNQMKDKVMPNTSQVKKCVFNSNHDACVSKFLNDKNARTKKPNVVPISTRKPKSQANKSVATPHKKPIVQLILFIVDSGCTKHRTIKFASYGLMWSNASCKHKWEEIYSGLVPQRQKALDYDNHDPALELQNVSPLADATVPSQQELDLLFGPLYDELFNDGTSRVNKSSSPTDNSAPQDTHPSTNIQPTSEPSTPTNAHAKNG